MWQQSTHATSNYLHVRNPGFITESSNTPVSHLALHVNHAISTKSRPNLAGRNPVIPTPPLPLGALSASPNKLPSLACDVQLLARPSFVVFAGIFLVRRRSLWQHALSVGLRPAARVGRRGSRAQSGGAVSVRISAGRPPTRDRRRHQLRRGAA